MLFLYCLGNPLKAKLWIEDERNYLIRIKTIFTLICSDSACKVNTDMICWNRFKLMRINAFSNLAVAASAGETSWIKNRSRDRGWKIKKILINYVYINVNQLINYSYLSVNHVLHARGLIGGWAAVHSNTGVGPVLA